MSKIALITDIHFGVRNDSRYFLDSYEKFFGDIFFPALQKYEVKTVLNLGDTWDDRKMSSINTFHRTRKMFLDPLREKNIEMKMLLGNHDVVYRNSNEVNFVTFLGDMYPNVEVVYKPKVFTFGKTKIAMMSWINQDNHDESLKFIETAKADILCGHFEIKSFEMLRGYKCEHGFDKTIFDRYEKVFSGHFHTMSTDGKITYISNPFQTTWGDYGLKKGFRIFDTETGELTLVENPFAIYDKVFYRNDIDVIKFPYENYENKIVRVYIESFSDINQNQLNLFMERLNKHAHTADLIESAESMVAEASLHGIEGVAFDTDTKSLIAHYVKSAVSSASVDTGVLVSYFHELLKEAEQQVYVE